MGAPGRCTRALGPQSSELTPEDLKYLAVQVKTICRGTSYMGWTAKHIQCSKPGLELRVESISKSPG